MRLIRLATSDDLHRVMDIIRAVTEAMDARGIHQWDEHYPDRSVLQTDIERHEMYVIEEDGKVWGLIAVNEQQAPEYRQISWNYAGKILVVHRLAVAPERQGEQLASQLMSFAENHAATNGYDAVRLDAFSQNSKALAVYEHRGYRKAGAVLFRKGLFCCYEKATSADPKRPVTAESPLTGGLSGSVRSGGRPGVSRGPQT